MSTLNFKAVVIASVLAGTASIGFWGCSTPKPLAKSSPVLVVPPRDSTRALEYFVEGAMHDMRNEYADAILEYEEAFRFDNAAPIAYALAKDYYELHKASRAAHFADAAIARDSQNSQYRLLRARIAMNLQMDFTEAQHQFESILEVDSFDTQSLSDLATLYQYRGQPRRAAVLYERLMDVIGSNADVGTHLVQIYSDLGDFPRAIAVLKQCLREEPDDPSFREMLASAYLHLRQTDSALTIYRDLVERYPDESEARHTLADLLSSMSRWDEAFVHYRILCEDSSVSGDTLNLVLDSLYGHLRSKGMFDDSIFQILSEVALEDTSLWYPCVLCGGACLFAHEDSAANSWMNAALHRTADSISTLVSIGQVYLEREYFNRVLDVTIAAPRYRDFRLFLIRSYALNRLHHYEEAVSSLYSSLEIFPRNWLALAELALYHEEEKHYPAADSAFEAALEIKPDYALALNNYSYSLAERGVQLDRALDMSRRALDLEPHNLNYVDTYGWILFKLSKLDSAAFYIQRAVDDRNPSSAVIEHLGDVQFKRGLQAEAVHLWERALKLDDHNEILRAKINAQPAEK